MEIPPNVIRLLKRLFIEDKGNGDTPSVSIDFTTRGPARHVLGTAHAYPFVGAITSRKVLVSRARAGWQIIDGGMMIKPEKQTRFYDKNGNPQWDAGLREARKFDYLPSHTSILNVLAKPGLEAWKQNRVLKTCFKMPSHTSYNYKYYSDMIY